MIQVNLSVTNSLIPSCSYLPVYFPEFSKVWLPNFEIIFSISRLLTCFTLSLQKITFNVRKGKKKFPKEHLLSKMEENLLL